MKFIQFFTGFFQESDGSSSMMRLSLFFTITGMIGLAFFIEAKGEWNIYNSGLIVGTIGASGLMKYLQKTQEVKESVEETKAAVEANKYV